MMPRLRLGSWYDDRPERERRVIGWALAVVFLALIAWLYVANERTRTRLEGELPRLRASIATLEKEADEVRRLRAMPAVQPQATTPLASLATAGGGIPGAQINVVDDKRVRLTGGDVAFASLLEWLNNARASHGMRVESARLEALASPGRVRADLTLSRS